MSEIFNLHLTCPRGIELLLADEATELGMENAKALTAGVSGTATIETAYKICLWSRLANRVLLVLEEFEAKETEELYQTVRDIDWSEHMTANSTFSIVFNGNGCGINNTHFGALKIKDAIVDYFRDTQNRRPSVAKENPDLRIHMYVERTSATLSLDLSGESLHMRGYRKQQGAAPMKENLAAAILIRSGWPKLMKEGKALTDPMCGVGTLLIEGAMMAADIAPNLKRQHWGFEGWLGHVPRRWEKLIVEAEQRAKIGLAQEPLWIRGYEADPRLIQPARNNLERAGLSDWVNIYQGELQTFHPRPNKGQTGLVVVNPPYGERLGDAASLLYLYQHLGARLREACLGWQAGIFTGNADLCKRMGLRSHKQYAFMNGALPCKLVLLNIVNAQFVIEKSASERLMLKAEKAAQANAEAGESGAEPNTGEAELMLSEGAQMFANRLKKNLKKLGKWARKNDISCYRLYDADMPEYAVAIDRYDDMVHVQEYAPPKTIDPAKAEIRLLDVIAAIPKALDIPREQIVLKRREKQSGRKQYEKHGEEKQFTAVMEGGAKLLVNLTDYLDTGLFLDHRPMRLRIQQEATGKRFLNLYCYTATATVHAAVGGARSSTSVDLSNTYLEWGQKNLSINGFSNKHQLVRSDVQEWLQENHEEFDLIFIDPPTFSNSKRTDDVFDIQRDHAHIIELAMRRLSADGTLYFSNNFRRFKMDDVVEVRYKVEDITKQTLDMDFERNQKIHKAWKISHKSF